MLDVMTVMFKSLQMDSRARFFIILCFTVYFRHIECQSPKASKENVTVLEFSKRDLTMSLSQNDSFQIFLKNPVLETVWISLDETANDVVQFGASNVTFTEENVINITVRAKQAGHVTVFVSNTSDANISFNDAFVRVSIYNKYWLEVFSIVIGWIYFVAWSISFYPQTYSNFKRKSVAGLNFDFVALNITGFICYSIFNLGLYCSKDIQAEYRILYPFGVIPVELNDVVFGLHAACATIIQIIQCLIYHRNGQTMSKLCIGCIGTFLTASVVFLIVTWTGVNHYIPWLTFLYFFSYVKLAITLVKYVPQVYFNYCRQSTVGWSIGNILLDCTGGSLSMLQMFIIAYNYHDWNSLFGNFTKFGLGLISILFDIIFLVQHYILYHPKRAKHSESTIDLIK